MTQDQDHDQALLEATARGDRPSFEVLVRRFEGPLYRFLLRTTGSAALAEEARQLTLWRVLTRARQYRGGSVTTWIFRIAFRVAANLRRERGRRREVTFDGDAAVEDPAPPPESRVLEKERQLELREAFAQLSEPDRTLLWLRIAEGLPMAEVARILDRPATTLQYRLTLALKTLRSNLRGPAAENGTPHAMF